MARATKKDKDVEQEPEVEDVTEDEATEATETKRTRRPGPSYGLAKIGDALPDNAKAERQSRQVYVDLLQPIVEDEDNWGEWFQVAEFNTIAGAKDAAKAIKAGERDVPEGEWEFEYRRLRREDGSKFSVLFARYLGN